MKIVVDNKIPFIKGVFDEFAEMVYAEGSLIDSALVKDADALIVRTRTMCDAALLDGSSVRFIATATIGFDHIDTSYCQANNIQWTNAPGCNADAVVQYVFAALGELALKCDFDLKDKVLGIIGVGNVGRRIAAFAEKLGMVVLKNDPPRADFEGGDEFVSLDVIKETADIITFHTPLNRGGEYSTFHLCDENFVSSLGRKPILINASRGEVCDNDVIAKARIDGRVEALVIDCWEKEPNIDRDLLNVCDVSTFHIAGYSLEGKANATTASVRALSRYFDLGMDEWKTLLPEKMQSEVEGMSDLEKVMVSYAIMKEDALLKANPSQFENLRGDYDFRREPDVIHL